MEIRGLSRKLMVLVGPLVLMIACNAVGYLSEEFSSLEQGIPVEDAELTPIELPDRWTVTPTLSPMPTRMKTDTPTPTPTYSLESVSTPYALNELGPEFTLSEASITTADLPAGFISISMQDLFGEMITGFFGEGSEFAELMPEDEQLEDTEMDLSNVMNFTMLLSETTGTTITSAVYLFNTEAEQQQFDQELQQDPEALAEQAAAAENPQMYDFEVLTGFENIGELSQAVEMSMVVTDEAGVEQVMSSGVVNFRRGPVGVMLMVMQLEGVEQVNMKNLAVVLDQRIGAALDSVSYNQ
ncbi:MAG: hypothetical protein JXA25_12510 [Anaerolineales bacterium]|nr:hypothetical protein [Anaerolineales bacterium]